MLATEHQIRVVGIPASIDNDIGSTSICIGVDTALNTIVDACDRISDTASAHRRAFVVEVMGRDCGYLAMASAIAVEADAVMFREQGRADDEVLEQLDAPDLEDLFQRNGQLGLLQPNRFEHEPDLLRRRRSDHGLDVTLVAEPSYVIGLHELYQDLSQRLLIQPSRRLWGRRAW